MRKSVNDTPTMISKQEKNGPAESEMVAATYENDESDESTASNSNDDNENDDVDHDDDDDDDKASLSLVLSQHWMAIIIAFVAALLSHLHFNLNYTSSIGFGAKMKGVFQFDNKVTTKHDYLDNYHRTSSLKFCESSAGGQNLEFYLPFEFKETLKLLYYADVLQIDDYDTEKINSQKDHAEKLLLNHVEYQCLLKQQQTTVLKGWTMYTPSPPLSQLYPHHADAGLDGRPKIEAPPRDLSLPPLKRNKMSKFEPAHLVFTGFGSKFINLSSKPILLFWSGKNNHEKLVGEIAPFESIGTATMPGQSFFVSPVYDSSTALQRWVVTADDAIMIYEPEDDDMKDNESFSYQLQRLNLAFARDYLISSKRTWFANFPRPPPVHFMYDPLYIGQTISVDEWTLNVQSVTPKVLTIDNFLSKNECLQIISQAKNQLLEPSTMFAGGSGSQMHDTNTRSSSTTWLPRGSSDITQVVFEKASRLLQVDLDLLQKFHDSDPHHHGIAESLQVVHYKKGGDEYHPHHDYVVGDSHSSRHQPTRFATLLIYLNNVAEGGETRFPRAVTIDKAEGVVVTPKQGTAVLFYNMLPDGNIDDLSQHGSNPTAKQDKWVTNLWIWDPIIN